MKRFLSLLLAVLMVMSLCACGSNEQEASGSASGDPASTEPQANINPTYINWGSRRNTLQTSDPWYPNGKLGDDYIYFDIGDSSSGIVYYKVEGGAQTGYAACELTKKNHLVTEGEGTSIDILFHNEFYAYDLKTETWYVRANVEFMTGMFSGRSFVEKNDSGNTIVFNADGTALEVYQGQEYPGTWKIINATTVRFNDGEYDYDFELAINSQNQLDGLDEYGNRYFVYAN